MRDQVSDGVQFECHNKIDLENTEYFKNMLSLLFKLQLFLDL